MAAEGLDATGATRTYKVVSANFRDKSYPDGLLLLDEARSEMELRQWTGRRKKEQAVVARFRIEPTASVLVDGPLLRVADFSATLDSPATARALAELLRGPAKVREALRLLSESESAVQEFLRMREEALTFLSALKVEPRKAMVGAEVLWTNDDTKEPLEAIHAEYSARIAISLEKMNSFLGAIENHLGASVVRRFYALTYTIGMVQNGVFRGDPDLGAEASALSEMGITVTPQDLRGGLSSGKLMQLAHPALAGMLNAPSSG